MEQRPAPCRRIGADPEYVARLVAALTEAGKAFEDARLKDDIISCSSWPHDTNAEVWARALVQLAFSDQLTSTALHHWLNQKIGGTCDPGDPAFFDLMTSCVQGFTDAVLEMICPATTTQGGSDAARDGIGHPRQGSKIDQAIGLRTKHPDWTAARIAKEVGCSLANLSQSRRWKSVEKAIADAAQKATHKEGRDRRARDRGGRHRGRDMDEYTASGTEQRGPAKVLCCASKGCGDPADTDAHGRPLVYADKPRCRECWEELTAEGG
jgi:hypothetical protein